MGAASASRVASRVATLADASAALRSGACTARDLLASAIARRERTRGLNAFVGGVLPRAEADAAASDARRAAGSPPLSRLDGAPVAVKDNFVVPGAPTTAGSRALFAFAPDADALEATAARRLREAGAVLFAKTNMDEFGMGSANRNSAHGACVSPWRAAEAPGSGSESAPSDDEDGGRARVAGGSSGGSAVAVASGAVPLALGSDTGGSVRLPAAYNGLVGLKPSYGRVSRWGLVPYCSSLDCPGFLASSVADVASALDATQGADPLDPTTIDADPRIADLARELERRADERRERRASRDREPPPEDHDRSAAETKTEHVQLEKYTSRRAHSREFPLAGWRVGIPREYDVEEMSEEVRVAWRETARLCESLGALAVPVSLPTTRAALAAYYVLAPAEASSNLARYDGVRYGGAVDSTDGSSSDGSSSDGSSADSSDASYAKAVSEYRAAHFGAETRRRILVGSYVLGTDVASRYFEKAARVRRLVSRDFERVFAGGEPPGAANPKYSDSGGASSNTVRGSKRSAGFGFGGSHGGLGGTRSQREPGVDVLLTPTAPTVAPGVVDPDEQPLGGFDAEYRSSDSRDRSSNPPRSSIAEAYAADAMTVAASLAGVPAVSVPVGLGVDSGLPVGAQVVAAYGGEADALFVAAALEAELAELGAEGGGWGRRAGGGILEDGGGARGGGRMWCFGVGRRARGRRRGERGEVRRHRRRVKNRTERGRGGGARRRKRVASIDARWLNGRRVM
jgi:aspartyl-tRNA(Asn)/glutamyl-tRNA(Gln) amidotransferase subunit A